MHRTNGMRHYRWQPLRNRVQSWYDCQHLAVLELPTMEIDSTFGTTHTVPRASTLLIKLRYEKCVAFILFVTPAKSRANLTVIRKTFGASTAWLSTRGEVQSLTRSMPGCVPAFGSIFNLPVVLDANLAAGNELFVPSGRPCHAVRIPVEQFLQVERPQLINFNSTDHTPGETSLIAQIRVKDPSPAAARIDDASSTCVPDRRSR